MPDTSGSYGLLENLTRPVVENLSDVPVVSAAFAALLEEVAAPTEGTRALTSALMKACLVVLLRRHLETSRIAGTVPAMFQDALLSRAITAILNRSAAEHSLTSLAKKAGMSRYAFAPTSSAATNLTPREFIAHIRCSITQP